MPANLLAAPESDLSDRMACLVTKSLRPTLKEKKGRHAMKMFKGTEVRPQLKQKFQLENDKVVHQQPAKKAKSFTYNHP